MSHVRTQLRNQAITELSAISQFTGVTSTRLSPLRVDANQLPYCNVYTDDEASSPQTMNAPGARKVERDMNLTVEIYQTGTEDGIDVLMDDLCVEVEKILGNSTLNNIAHDVSLQASGFDFDGA